LEGKPVDLGTGGSPMPLNFKEGMRRLGMVAGVLGAAAGAIGGYFLAMDAHTSGAKGLLGEPVLVDYGVAVLLPVVGFVLAWGAFRALVWICAGFLAEPRTASHPKFHGKIARLTKLIDEAEHLLRRHGEETWAKWLAEECARIRNRDFSGIEHILSGFGGAGSFNDVYICPANHHAIKERHVSRVNDRLRVMSSRIYELASELQDEEQATQSSRARTLLWPGKVSRAESM
jgi:hypothetical protein